MPFCLSRVVTSSTRAYSPGSHRWNVPKEAKDKIVLYQLREQRERQTKKNQKIENRETDPNPEGTPKTTSGLNCSFVLMNGSRLSYGKRFRWFSAENKVLLNKSFSQLDWLNLDLLFIILQLVLLALVGNLIPFFQFVPCVQLKVARGE